MFLVFALRSLIPWEVTSQPYSHTFSRDPPTFFFPLPLLHIASRLFPTMSRRIRGPECHSSIMFPHRSAALSALTGPWRGDRPCVILLVNALYAHSSLVPRSPLSEQLGSWTDLKSPVFSQSPTKLDPASFLPAESFIDRGFLVIISCVALFRDSPSANLCSFSCFVSPSEILTMLMHS